METCGQKLSHNKHSNKCDQNKIFYQFLPLIRNCHCSCLCNEPFVSVCGFQSGKGKARRRNITSPQKYFFPELLFNEIKNEQGGEVLECLAGLLACWQRLGDAV
jgi:hypothetical protein